MTRQRNTHPHEIPVCGRQGRANCAIGPTNSAIGRNKSVIANIQNALSFAEVQDGALQTSATIVNRMSELRSMSLDVIKSSADVANYNVEFVALQEQLHSLASEKFNGVSLFGQGPAAGGAQFVVERALRVSVGSRSHWVYQCRLQKGKCQGCHRRCLHLAPHGWRIDQHHHRHDGQKRALYARIRRCDHGGARWRVARDEARTALKG